MRLARYLAHGGVASRRRAEEIIAHGRVTVGGEVVTDPARDATWTTPAGSPWTVSRWRPSHGRCGW
jgi:23S rRNA pseudouridine2605 synthase